METAEKPKTALINQVQKRVQMELWDIVKFQILIYCHFNNIHVSDQELDCTTLLTLCGNSELTDFCTGAIKKNISGNTQSVRNALAKLEKRGLIIKTGRSKKRISVNPTMNIQAEGNILLDFKILRRDSKEA